MKMPSLLQTGVLIATAGLIVSSCAASQASERADMGPPLHPFESEQIQPPEATASLLPEGVGRDTTIRVCSGCHAVELVAEKHLTRQEWFDLVQFMGDRGATGTAAEMAQITDYLARSFPKK
ncbi:MULTISPECIES: hypothetical protein [unclassified Brevundimonas]